MRLTTRCSIALHCLVFISEYEDRTKITSELLAKSTGCNPAAIRNILGVLQKEGIISIARGIGGAHLIRSPETLTAWEVYHAVEPDGLEHLLIFHPKPSLDCPVGRHIKSVLNKPYQDIGAAVREMMEKITLKQLLDDYHNCAQEIFDYVPESI
ncbi:MAG: Rrf2 family transcriptional regulator [Oscillospiraceae bacterium]|nr:Rrf2 family transcriptional regulator [Oscillospiraceae bacterium]